MFQKISIPIPREVNGSQKPKCLNESMNENCNVQRGVGEFPKKKPLSGMDIFFYVES